MCGRWTEFAKVTSIGYQTTAEVLLPQAVGGQHQGAIGQPRLASRGASFEAVENVFEAELLEGLAEG